MNELTLKTYPDPCLRIRAKPVERFGRDLKVTLHSMLETMYDRGGIGLAATQVGLGLRMFVMDLGEGATSFVNPEIVDRSNRRTRLEEGCLSLPGITVTVSRPEKIKVRAQDETGDFFIRSYDSLAAKVVQHESDHLNGRVIIDYLDPFRSFWARRTLLSRKRTNTQGKCEVICHVGKKDRSRA